jgi:hypothetical protein
MKITFHGDLSFTIATSKGQEIYLNPKKEQAASSKLIFTIFNAESNQEDFASKKAINWPGEYELEGVLVKSFNTEKNQLAHFFKIEDVRFGFLNDLSIVLNEEQLEPLVNSDVLFLPKTSSGLKNKELKKIVEEIDPRIIILMGETALFPELLKELGSEPVQSQQEYAISVKNLPVEHTEIVELAVVN